MRRAGEFLSKIAEINSDIEIAIAKILRKKEFEELEIGKDDNGVNCVLYKGKPLRFYKVEENIDLLEQLEKED